MTATVLTKENPRQVNPALHNWKSNIKNSRKLTIIITILHFVAVPITLLATIISVYSKNGGNDVEMYAVIAVLTTALAAFLGIFAATESFRYLHDKSVVDMKLSLPMNNTQRFVSDFLSGLFTYIAPFLCSQVVSLLLCGYGCLFMDGRTFYRITYDYSYNNPLPVNTPYVCDIFGEAMPILLKLIAGGTLCMLMLYVTTVLISVCCGSKFEAIAYTILINALIPLTILCVFYSMFNNLYGINAEDISIKAILYTSVAGGVIATIDWATSGDILYGDGAMNYGVWFAVFSLIIIALLALSFFLYRKRRAEQVSKPFVFKLAYYIVISCAMFCIISLFVAENGELVPMLITSGIVYMIFEVVTNRGFRRFWLSIIKYIATVIAVVAVIFICEETDGFGAVQRVPSVLSVKSVEIDYGGFYDDLPAIYDRGNVSSYLFKDEENISAIVDAHQAIVDYYNENNKTEYINNYSFDEMTTSRTINITYNLKTGGSFTRTYNGYSAKPIEFLMVLDVSDEFKMQAAEMYKQFILNAEELYNDEIERRKRDEENGYTDYYSYDEFSVYAHNTFPFARGDSFSTHMSMESLIARDFLPQLADAYYKDIMAISEENYFRSELKNEWTLYVPFVSSLSVPESFTNTVELLEYFDIGLTRVENLTDEDMYCDIVERASNSEIKLLTADEFRELCKVDEENPLYMGYVTNKYYNYSYNFKYNDETYVYDFDENFCNLARAAMPRNIVDENGYVIYVRGFTGAIPAEMNSEAASVQRSGFDENKEAYYNRLYNELNGNYYD